MFSSLAGPLINCFFSIYVFVEKRGRLEMGQRLEMMLGLSPGFLRMGVMVASLRESGTDPEQREELMMAMMSGERTGKQVVASLAGIGSRKG